MAYDGVYKNRKGGRLPSVTTIIKNIGWSTEMLMAWQNRMWEQGKDPRTVSKEACDIGTVTHELIEAHIYNQDEYIPGIDVPNETVVSAMHGLKKYIEWEEEVDVEYLESELKLISEEHQYGGTADAVARIGDETVLIDFKTSKGVYDAHIIQLAAYKHMIEECMGYKIDRCIIIKIDKEPETIDNTIVPYYIDDSAIEDGWKVFEMALQLNEYKKAFSRYTRKLNKH